MNPTLLLLIASDPRTSHRPAEAIRVAAGIHASNQVRLSIYLHQNALLALHPNLTELVDEDNYRLYLPLLAQPPAPLYTLADNPALASLGQPSFPCQLLAPHDIANLAAAARYILRY